MSKEVTEIINTLCEKLGVAASVLVPEMARYSIARLAFLTVVQTILAVVMAVIVVKLVKLVKWSFGDEDVDFEDKALSVFCTCIVPGIAMVVFVYLAISSATDLIGWIASPTASAVKEITSMIR